MRYFLNLVLVDEEDRRYFKQQVSYKETCGTKTGLSKEITLWRKAYLNENRIPTNQFISSQLPNGNFANEKKEQTQLSPEEAPEAAF